MPAKCAAVIGCTPQGLDRQPRRKPGLIARRRAWDGTRRRQQVNSTLAGLGRQAAITRQDAWPGRNRRARLLG